MASVRKWSFVALLLTIGFVGVVQADGYAFCNYYGGECTIDENSFSHFGPFVDCESQHPDYCDDAWWACIDHCGGGPDMFFCDGGNGDCTSSCQCSEMG